MASQLARIDRTSPVSAVTRFTPHVALAADDVTELARLMVEGDCGSLIVHDSDGNTCIVTERDLVHAVAAGDLGVGASSLMSDGAVTVASDVSIADAAAAMLEAGVRHLVVDRGDGGLGVTSIRDVVEALLVEDTR